MLMCCLKPEEDDVQVLDYEHSSLSDVPAEVFNHERTLEILRLDCNQIADLPRPLFHCHGLKELWLSDNEIALLPPALASLIHLQVRNFFKFSILKEENRPSLNKNVFSFSGVGYLEKLLDRSARRH
jgi:erbb2-interacting protein